MTEKLFYTYLYTDPKNNNPIYVGKGQDKRAWAHFKTVFNPRLTYLLKKRTKEGFIIEPVLTYWPSEKAAFAGEIFWIATYGREDLGKGTLFNRTDGGDSPPSAKGLKRTKEWKEKHQIPCLEETKKKIGDANRNRKLGPSWNKDIPMSAEAKLKQSIAHIGKKSPMSGKTHKESSKDKLSQVKTKYYFTTPKGIFNVKREMHLAFPEFTTAQLDYFTINNKNGFSRTLKDY